MINPNDVKGENPERDAEILNLYLEGLSPQEIIDTYNSNHPNSILDIGIKRIEAIVYINRPIVNIDIKEENVKQVLRIKRQIKKKHDSKKDLHDWEMLLHQKIGTQKVEHSGKVEGGELNINVYPSKVLIFKDIKEDATTGRTDNFHAEEGASGSRTEVKI